MQIGSNIPPIALPATPAMDVWGDAKMLQTYDMALFSCECSEQSGTKGGGFGAPAYGVVTDYLNSGGRLLTTDFQYVWYKFSPDPMIGETVSGSSTTGIGVIPGAAPIAGSPITLDTTLTPAKALADWLKVVFPSGTYAQVTPDVTFANITSLDSEPVTWGSSPNSSATSVTGPRIFSLNTPVGVASPKQCGQGIHIDAHVESYGTTDVVGCTAASAEGGSSLCYPSTCTTPLTEGEAMFAFYFFQLSACIP